MACVPARAEQTPQTRLRAVERALDESRAHQSAASQAVDALAAEIAELREQSVVAAKAAQDHEAALNSIEAGLAALALQEKAKAAALERDRAHQTELLMALTRLAVAPPEGLALAPGTPLDALRGAVLMGRAVPPLAAQAETLKHDIAALEALRSDIAAARDKQQTERAALSYEQARVAQLIARKAALLDAASRNAEEDRRRGAALAAEAGSLRDLVDRLEVERRKAEAARLEAERRQAEAERNAAAPPPEAPGGTQVAVTAPPPVRPAPAPQPRHIRPFSEAQGAFVFPVTGSLVLRYCANDEFGAASHGLTFETRPGAQVVAPFDGQVMFAGPFRGYGQILIIGHGDGYHSLLAGLDRLDSSVGQWLVAGEPVGTMSGEADKPRLYLELRHNNQPINPTPWLTTRVEKVNG
jgi:murein hydrolase activator